MTFLFIAGLGGCQQERPTPDAVLLEAINKINNHPAIRYKYISYWNTKLNETVYADSAQIIYSSLDSSYHGFGFYVNKNTSESLFDGVSYHEIRHSDQMIVRHDANEIKNDSNYFANFLSFYGSPFEIKTAAPFDQVLDTLLQQQHYYIYIKSEEKPSLSDTTKTVRSDRLYYIDSAAKLVRRIQNITCIDQDTAQVIDIRFSAIRFDTQPYDFKNIERSAAMHYREIGIQELDNEQYLQQIAEGNQLAKRIYKDMDGREVSLFGAPRMQTLIMFSFIGCGGCELALRELNNKQYKIKPGLNFYYSSPVDKATTLQAYLHKKNFPFAAFARESLMNDDFSIVFFPTFVLIDNEGLVTKVISGYDTEVNSIIFEHSY